MPAPTRVRSMLTIACILIAMSFSACGAAASAAQNGQDGAALHVTFTKLPFTLFSADVHNDQAVTRLYRAALALPRAPEGVYHCPADDGGVYHLNFSGGATTIHHMDVKASGCRFITFVDVNETHLMDDTFVALFTKTVGLPSLDPWFP